MTIAPNSDPQVALAPGIDAARDLSLALLGHDLRSLLGEMRSGLHLLAALDLPQDARTSLDRCRTVGETLNRLLDQSMLVCLGQGSPVTAGSTPVATAEFLDALRLRWTGRAEETGHNFNLIVAGDLPETFTIDRTALDRVLANLIGNALRHTPAGPITMTFKASGGDLLLIAVEDNGPGFPTAHLAAIQKDFALPPEARREGGGLGLQSVKLLIEAMGGRCNARNKGTGGAEVGICLPLAPNQPPKTATSAPGLTAQPVLALPPDMTGTRVLLAEDNAACRDLARALMAALKADLTMVMDGEQAIAALQAGPLPSILILDDEMPGLSGRQILHWLRAQGGANAQLPVLVLTSHIAAAEVAALHQAGANEVLTKPVLCPLELGRALRRAQGFDATPAAAAAANPIDLSALKRLGQLAGPEAAAELLQRLAEDLSTASTGLAIATQTADLAGIRAHSHVIIALAGTAGATALHAGAVTLNNMADGQHPQERVIALAESLAPALEALTKAVLAIDLFDAPKASVA